jgi:hypothetical protein
MTDRFQILPAGGGGSRRSRETEGVSAADSTTADILYAWGETPSVALRQLPLKGSIWL